FDVLVESLPSRTSLHLEDLPPPDERPMEFVLEFVASIDAATDPNATVVARARLFDGLRKRDVLGGGQQAADAIRGTKRAQDRDTRGYRTRAENDQGGRDHRPIIARVPEALEGARTRALRRHERARRNL